jgi:hypothetical protein
MRRNAIPVWLAVSGIALLAGAALVRYVIATPSPEWNKAYQGSYTLPFDPLGLANKWFILSILALIGGTVLYVLWRKNGRSVGERTATTARDALLVFGFWLALVCAVELSSNQWTYVAFGESRSNITPEMERDPHFLIYPMEFGGGDSVKIYRVISKQRSNLGMNMIARNTTPDVASDLFDSLRDDKRKAQLRGILAGLCWVAALAIAVVFVRFRQHELKKPDRAVSE